MGDGQTVSLPAYSAQRLRQLHVPKEERREVVGLVWVCRSWVRCDEKDCGDTVEGSKACKVELVGHLHCSHIHHRDLIQQRR